MNILLPDSWLREYLDTLATPLQIKNYLSLCGPTVESINKIGNDSIYNIEITSNRVDMASVYGIAREAAVILPRFNIPATLKGINIEKTTTSQQNIPINISDPEKICNRILGIVMGVDPTKESPDYVKDRLEKAGVRSLNNLVNITNYIMLEVGHPTHVFDYDRVKSHTFIIRRAKKGEPIITLDNKKYLLTNEDVVIDDGTGQVIDLPGIMGTENSVVTDSTRRILFFIESNNPVLIRKTSMRYGIRTMAAAINEKHPSPELAKLAMLRGIKLYEDLADAKILSNLIDIYPHKAKTHTITVSCKFINDRLGIVLKKDEIIEILKALQFTVLNLENGTLQITPPTFRQFDITIPEDIVEEVARIYGYHNLPSRLMSGEIPITDKPKDLPVEEKLKTILKYWGFTECYHYSFVSRSLIEKANLNPQKHIKIINPLTPETEYMRINLIPSLLDTAAKNQHLSQSLNLFELAKVYIPKDNSLPQEISMLSILTQIDFWKLKGIVYGILDDLGVQDYIESPTSKSLLFHPLQTLNITKNGKEIVTLGKLYPYLFSQFNLMKDTYIAYFDVENLVSFYNPAKKYISIPQYPPLIEDLSFSLPPKTYLGPLISQIYKIDKIIKNIKLLGSYKNKITLRIFFQSSEKNLKTPDIQKIVDLIRKTISTME